jgi:hypothetical protein
MFSIVKRIAAAAAISALATGTAFAASALGISPLPAQIITNAGLEWVYASPCQGTPDPDCGSGNAGVLLFDGFHFASSAEWSTWSNLAAFQAAMAPVSCASPNFSISFDNCDFGDLAAGFVWGSPLTDPGQAANAFSETFLVRGAAVPEPGTAALVALSLGLVGWTSRRRRHA